MADLVSNFPQSLGYRMPAEWSLHYGTWLSWPTNEITWPDRLERVQEVYLDVIEALAFGEQVLLLVDDETTREAVLTRIRRRSSPVERVSLFVIPTVDGWIRDYGPNFLTRTHRGRLELAFNRWRFNAWGDKYEDLKADGEIPGKLDPILGVPIFEPGIVLEGGSIEVNGEGLCLTTEQCLLNPNRNPHLSRSELEAVLRRFLGVERIFWLEEGIEGDDTDGHVDDIVRFTSPNQVVCALEADAADANFEPLRANFDRLKRVSELEKLFEVAILPMPDPIYAEGQRLPASYANFLIANELVLMPSFGQRKDRVAKETLQGLFPNRRVVEIDSRDLIWGMGAIHCLSQQQPQGECLLNQSG